MSQSSVSVRIVGDSSAMVEQTRRAEAGLQAFGNQAKRAGDQAKRAGDQAAQGMGQAQQGLQSISQQLEALGSQAKAYIGVQAVVGTLSGLARDALQASLAMDRLNRTLKFASDGAQDYASTSDFLRRKVRELGLDLESAGNGFASLSAAARATKLEGEGARSIFDAVAKASTVMGLSAENTSGALMAITQMISKGTVQSEELRGQLGERLPGAFQIAVRAMGMTTQQLGKFLEQGMIATDVFLPRFAAQMRTEMAGSVESAADSVQANLNRVSTSWKQLLVTISNSDNFNETLKGLDAGLAGIAGALDRNKSAWPGWADMVARSVAIAAEGINLVWASVRGVKRESEGVYDTAGRFLREQAALVADSQLNGGKNKAAIKAQFAAEQTALDEGYEKDVAAIYSGLNKYTAAVEVEIAARKDRQAQLSLDPRARSAIGSQDGIQAFKDQELLATKPKLGASDGAAARLKQLADEQKLLADLAGVSQDYMKDLTLLQALRKSGNVDERAYVELVQQVIEKQPMVRAMRAEEAAALQAEEKARDAALASASASLASAVKSIAAMEDETLAAQLAGQMHITLAQAVAEVTIQRLEEQVVIASIAGDDRVVDKLRDEIKLRKELAQLIGKKAESADAAQAAQKAAEEWKRASGVIEQSLTDALLRGFESGKGFAQNFRATLVNMFKTTVLRPVIQAVLGPVAGGLAAAFGGSAQAGQGGGTNPAEVMNKLKSMTDSLKTMAGTGPGSLSGNIGLAINNAGNAVGSDSTASFGADMYAATPGTAGAMAGTAASYLAPALIGREIGKAISGEFSLAGKSGNAAINVGTVIGAIVGGPIGAGIGAAIGGVANRLFGLGQKKTTESGVTGSVGAAGFDGNQYADFKQKGGLFRRDKKGTDKSDTGAALDGTLDAGVKALYAASGEYAKALGLPVSAVTSLKTTFKVVWGKTEEENKAAIIKAMDGLNETLAAQFASKLTPFKKAGETLAGTLSRLSGIQVFSNNLNQLGGVFSKVAGLSVGAREQMIGLAGGLDAFASKAMSFAQNFYNRDEIAGLKAKEVKSNLASVGITKDIASKEEFRALVDSVNVTTEAGRKQLAALLDVQGEFVDVAQYLSETGKTLNSTATQAPVSDSLAPLFSAQTSATVSAADRTTAAVFALSERLMQYVKSSGTAPGAPTKTIQPVRREVVFAR